MIGDFLALGPLIEARLRDSGIGFAHVGPAFDLADLDEKSVKTPAAFVVYAGESPTDNSPDVYVRFTRQRWMTVLCIRNRKEIASGAGAREEAGPIIAKTIDTLTDWSPGTDFRALKRVRPPAPAYRPGFLYFPLAWDCDVLNRETD